MSEQGVDLSELLTLTADIVASHVSNNGVPVSELPQLIQRFMRHWQNLARKHQLRRKNRNQQCLFVNRSHLISLSALKMAKS